MGSSVSSFVDNIPIVWVVKKIIGSDSGNNQSISVGQPLPDNPIIFIPKQGPMREMPQAMGNPPVSEPGILEQIKSIDQNTLIYLVGGSVLLIILIR